MADAQQVTSDGLPEGTIGPTIYTQAVRAFGWAVVVTTFVFLINNYLIFWWDWPGLAFTNGQPDDLSAQTLSWLQAASYLAGIIGSGVFVILSSRRSLRQDSQVMTDIVTFIVRASFWAVFFVGLADMIISFLRIEGFLESLVGAEMTKDLGRSAYRGPVVHLPVIGLAIVVAAFTRTLGFTWLALLVVVAELQIVLTRFIFSYEQAFMGDLVRFWYAALFLFASAYTLLEDGHVRVDVLYAGFRRKTKGLVNAFGCLILGLPLCVVILATGMWGKSNVINSPLLSFEVSQSGFGMYVKYMMAGFLAIFAITMMIQFASYLLESVADYRGDPGGREDGGDIAH